MEINKQNFKVITVYKNNNGDLSKKQEEFDEIKELEKDVFLFKHIGDRSTSELILSKDLLEELSQSEHPKIYLVKSSVEYNVSQGFISKSDSYVLAVKNKNNIEKEIEKEM